MINAANGCSSSVNVFLDHTIIDATNGALGDVLVRIADGMGYKKVYLSLGVGDGMH